MIKVFSCVMALSVITSAFGMEFRGKASDFKFENVTHRCGSNDSANSQILFKNRVVSDDTDWQYNCRTGFQEAQNILLSAELSGSDVILTTPINNRYDSAFKIVSEPEPSVGEKIMKSIQEILSRLSSLEDRVSKLEAASK